MITYDKKAFSKEFGEQLIKDQAEKMIKVYERCIEWMKEHPEYYNESPLEMFKHWNKNEVHNKWIKDGGSEKDWQDLFTEEKLLISYSLK